ncbi:MAG: hypothetical protein V1722_04160 [Candidatus Micrarchaeota archaeon]
MKNELLYSFATVLAAFILSFVLFLFVGNENSKNAMLVLNIAVAFVFTHFYYKQSPTANANATNFSILLLAMSITLTLIIVGIIARQGVTAMFSLYMIVQTIERIAMPFVYEKLVLKK